jgi:hypothetical protein
VYANDLVLAILVIHELAGGKVIMLWRFAAPQEYRAVVRRDQVVVTIPGPMRSVHQTCTVRAPSAGGLMPRSPTLHQGGPGTLFDDLSLQSGTVMQERDDTRGNEVGFVDAHNMAGVRQDFDLAPCDVALGAPLGRRNVSH